MTNSIQGEKQFEGLLSLYLRERQAGEDSNARQNHLDEDSLSAFVEGILTQQQAAPILRHLVDCFLCRRVTAQLVELSIKIEDEVPFSTNAVKSSSNWHEFWNNLTESIFRPYDNAVTAHESEKEISKDQENESNKE